MAHVVFAAFTTAGGMHVSQTPRSEKSRPVQTSHPEAFCVGPLPASHSRHSRPSGECVATQAMQVVRAALGSDPGSHRLQGLPSELYQNESSCLNAQPVQPVRAALGSVPGSHLMQASPVADTWAELFDKHSWHPVRLLKGSLPASQPMHNTPSSL